ncbi:hypothetical protein KJ980_03965 [Patescibacteria group bacterium]|nr:hypothetical protein [Patescibacteria group bacterium]MBU4017163.1 hypothetical protein [Patescibacteria group bacterium]MBU4098780.1 hypothetical protein [Patescibacteria group bacterium]
MANYQIHEDQAKSNYSLLTKILRKSKYKDWKITVAFYTAVHIMECQLTKASPDWRSGNYQRDNPESQHAWREKCINLMFRDIFKHYRMLEIRSKTARYLEGTPGNITANDFISEKDSQDCLDNHLKKILKKFNYFW